jgi:hypothetical protein
MLSDLFSFLSGVGVCHSLIILSFYQYVILSVISTFFIWCHRLSHIVSIKMELTHTENYCSLFQELTHTKNYCSLFQELTHILKINAHCFRNWLTYWKLSLTVSGADSHTENYQSLFQELTHILKIISHCFVKYKMTLSIKTIMSVLKILTYIITSITSFPIWLTENLAIISVWTFVAVVILYRQLHSWIWVETLYGLFFLISFDNMMIFLSILYLT